MSNHTPEPWTMSATGLVAGRDSRERFSGIPSIDIFDASEWPAELHEEAMSNARLITAAPELLAHLKMLLGWIAGQRRLGIIPKIDFPAAKAIVAILEGNNE
jgi:hypothetical protein